MDFIYNPVDKNKFYSALVTVNIIRYLYSSDIHGRGQHS